jgi:hypothetical protein
MAKVKKVVFKEANNSQKQPLKFNGKPLKTAIHATV